jgi:hypothetical protein
MKILEQVLSKINFINKKQKNFLTILIQGLIGISGKRTFRNLARYMQLTEHTFARQMAKTLNFIGINAEIIKASKNEKEVLIAAQDLTFVPKSGKATHGLDYFWNGSASKAEKGLEVDVIAVVKVGDKKAGYTISAEQTPANPVPKSERKKKKATEFTKIDFCLNHVKKALKQLVDLGIQYMVVDAFFAKIKYISGLVFCGLHAISKLRQDASLRRIYTGPQKARGRRKKFATGKVNFGDFEQSLVTKIASENTELRSCIAYSTSLKRNIKVVLVRKEISHAKYGEAFLFSTDLELDTTKIYEYYVSRFQIEFIFRDAKGFTGLNDCQSRDARRIHYHLNASLTALNVVKIQDHELQQNSGVQHAFSMANWTRKYHVDIVINCFISMFGLDQTFIKSHPNYNSFLSFGNIIH